MVDDVLAGQATDDVTRRRVPPPRAGPHVWFVVCQPGQLGPDRLRRQPVSGDGEQGIRTEQVGKFGDLDTGAGVDAVEDSRP